jgi:hypothetical protein
MMMGEGKRRKKGEKQWQLQDCLYAVLQGSFGVGKCKDLSTWELQIIKPVIFFTCETSPP